MSQIDDENRKLKKKMKKKLESKKNGDTDGKKKGKKKVEVVDEDDDEEEELPAVKVRDYEMPEGAAYDSGNEDKLDKNDPHRALDINLDEYS
jgi:hypothetical protein